MKVTGKKNGCDQVQKLNGLKNYFFYSFLASKADCFILKLRLVLHKVSLNFTGWKMCESLTIMIISRMHIIYLHWACTNLESSRGTKYLVPLFTLCQSLQTSKYYGLHPWKVHSQIWLMFIDLFSTLKARHCAQTNCLFTEVY